ncbi:MarR family winged helix-turn-helix transcriptional regulator [Terrabacter sp. MAHUQ-38]|jgi:DNA-binding MarR family transcriptional regulator|uniref:MarR family winged helix-turn-helix transcriptional regulator n=1 Tax=unclassified Terrabacter TaxID=2630222 RepID=UPI00165D606A|nr:MarR family transcriptional regulator [Terrabacter sp. MAHUQ-38]MBC9819935.1 MarR family transcriptional regulator [Terrabacter sp. MAHUQ-38]
MARPTDDALAAAWHDLMGRYQRLTCTLDRELGAAHDLSASEFEVLQQLYATPEGKLKMAQLGERAHLSQSALSRLVSRLDAAGLVTRAACADDRRSVFAEITTSGRTRYEEAKPTQRRILREGASDCPAILA